MTEEPFTLDPLLQEIDREREASRLSRLTNDDGDSQDIPPYATLMRDIAGCPSLMYLGYGVYELAGPLRAIPESVLPLLRTQWPLPTDDNYPFRDRDRKPDPNPDYVRMDKYPEFQEALAMTREGVFGRMAEEQGSCVAINEHAFHALQAFCSDVYHAWSTYLDRLHQVERANPEPQQPAAGRLDDHR